MVAHAWHTDSNYLVLVAVPDEPALEALLDAAKDRDILLTEIREPDYDDALTAIVLEPTDASRRLCSSLPLTLRQKELVMS